MKLDNFEGPFDLLLTLINRRRLDLTEVALAQVTDDFLAFVKAAGHGYDLGEVTEFLLVAATLLELKTARLLPSSDIVDETDLALLEARDLLFARLLQYRAYKLAANHLAELDAITGPRHARQVELEERFATLTPGVDIGVNLARFAAIAAQALRPRPEPLVAVAHIHASPVSVSEQIAVLRTVLARSGTLSFRALIADCRSRLEVVARFLGLLELYREGSCAFEQIAALDELQVQWLAEVAESPGDMAYGHPSEFDLEDA